MVVEGAIDNTGTGDPAADALAFAIPEDYKDKPYMKDITSEEGLYKMLDGAQTLIGKKVNIPNAESSEEDRKAFNTQMGVPEKAEEYVFNKIGDQERNADMDTVFKNFLHKHDVPAEKATAMQGELELMAVEFAKGKTEADGKALDLDFDKVSAETFGENADSIIASTKKLIAENVPDNLKEAFNEMSNNNLIIMTSVLENFRKKYISEDDLTITGDPASGTSKVELEGELNTLVAKRKAADPFSGEYKALSAKITETSQRIAKF